VSKRGSDLEELVERMGDGRQGQSVEGDGKVEKKGTIHFSAKKTRKIYYST